ncbi:NAD(P)/FAD-dependent oxidoreductase [uncultured Paraglaciecola sp.]|uniref:NAD(P)/FAD-dependent oxidoreductase n=1 Tax=uncultured Paraglaciecola sp. TaxID=1765024 RepID=UPI0030DD9DCE|tara:strand:- start:4473 stop:5885 length:1413 start_codon:yes stop_codon:yes gene_type:complete
MTTITHETDYLIVGAGAIGMAFADVLLSETDANIIIVDKYQKPGGHWNLAYPFVTLHQPSAFYGVSSTELSKGCIDQVGLNKGLNELASGAEVSAYFDNIMRERFLTSGRVSYFPMCDYKGDGKFISMLNGDEHHVTIKNKIVDATYLKTSVPSTHKPSFTIDNNAQFIPINDLVKITNKPAGFIIIGGGKTGIDAVLWLLENNVDPDDIQWIMPRDAWLIDRKTTQPTVEFFNDAIGAQASQMEAIAQSTSVHDMFERLEKAGVFLRLDSNVWPKMFHGATISKMELAQLQRIKNMVRMGRVTHVGHDNIQLEQGEIKTSPEHIHVDCSASAITNLTVKPIFAGNVITPQTVRSYQPAFSSAFIAHIEAAYSDEKTKNHICGVVPLPNDVMDWLRITVAFMRNQHIWSQDKELKKWLLNNRLDGFSQLVRSVDKTDMEKMMILNRLRENAMPAMGKLQQYLAADAAQGA